MAPKTAHFGFLVRLIRKRERNVSSFATLIVFPAVLFADLIISVALDRTMRNGGAGDRFWYFEALHYVVFFSYAVLLYIQESSEIIQKTSLFPVPRRVLVAAIFTNSVIRFTTITLVVLSRVSVWFLYRGSVGERLAVSALSLAVMAAAGLAASSLCLRLTNSPRSLGLLSGAGFLAVLGIVLPSLG